MEQLRANRLNQLASRIVEAALGVGSENREKHWSVNPEAKNGNKTLRPRERINDPRFAVCQAVVIEDLSGYETKETRLRRENRMLAGWSKAEFRKFLSECCQLHGLHLRTVPAQ